MSWTTEAAVGLVVVMSVCAVQAGSCRCSNDEPKAPDASVGPPDAAPTASQGPADAAPDAPAPDAGAGWEVVQNLNHAEGYWGGHDEDPRIIIRCKETEEGKRLPWPYPFPWHVLFDYGDGKPYDCGFHSQMQDDGYNIGWRVAHCQGGHFERGRRHATGLWIYRKDYPAEMIKVRLVGELDDRGRPVITHAERH